MATTSEIDAPQKTNTANRLLIPLTLLALTAVLGYAMIANFT